jgi:Ni/Co efflux regulator RcnB
VKRTLAFATALGFLISGTAAIAQDRPMTRPATGQQPVGKPPGRPNPPGASKPPAHRPPHHRPPHKPPAHKPPHHRPPIHHRPPPGWHRPTASQWYWRGRWVNRIRGPAFVYPRGYSYRYWYAGDILPALLLTAQFFYDNVAPLGLDVPPPGYRWVRYGPDLLLVNLRTGEIEQVAYGAFY